MANQFIKYFEDSFRENWNLPAMSNYVTKQTYAYKDVAREIAKLHILFRELNIQQDDKIAFIGANTPEWAISFMATITYGAIAVPILQTFNPDDIAYIIDHSETKVLFVSDSLWMHIENKKFNNLRFVFSLSDFRCVYQTEDIICNISKLFRQRYTYGLMCDDVRYTEKDDNEMFVLSYTSGTAGMSKGVMLNGSNFCPSFSFAKNSGMYEKGFRTLSYLYLAHIIGYGCEIFMPLINGCEIFFLPNMPSPKNLVKTMQEVKPSVVSMVPLFVEKICEELVSKEPVDKDYNKLLGGNIKNIIIGGSLLSSEIELLLCNMKIPYILAYAMTECCIISVNRTQKCSGSVGRSIDKVEIQIDSEDPYTIPGEILVKGESVMLGYFRNEELTEKSMKDGWFKTGDLGVLDKEQNLYIKGRLKAMILSSSGQNIYPEEIEFKLNQSLYVIESIVVKRDSKLVALVFPNYSQILKDGVKDIHAEFNKIRKELNRRLAFYEYVSEIIIQEKEFEKSSKRSIKRYLYS